MSKVVLITGGGSGIGLATARKFARKGNTVVVCGRTSGVLKAASGTPHEGRIIAFQVDVTDASAVAGLVAEVAQKFGRISVLVNSAGQAFAKPICETTLDEWRRMLEVNLLGSVNCCNSVLPSMIAAGEGTIINVSSILGKQAVAGMAAYSASKFAVNGFTQSLAAELKGAGVSVYAVCPGATDTPLHRGVVGDEMAKHAMNPDRVAELIYGVATGKVPLAPGNDITIDGEPPAHCGFFLRLIRAALRPLRQKINL